jgi:hypothetical protein
LTFFNIGCNIYGATLLNGVYMHDPAIPPVITVPPVPSWPTAVGCLSLAGQYDHLTLGAPGSNMPGSSRGPFTGVVAFASRRLSLAAIGAIAQVNFRFQAHASRLAGLTPNVAALASNIAQQLGLAPYVVLPATPLVPTVTNYVASRQDMIYAQNCASDLKANDQIFNAREMNVSKLALEVDCIAEYVQPAPVELIVLNGLPGVGKSYYIRSQLPTWLAEGPVRFHSWNVTLRGQIQRAFKPLVLSLGYLWPTGTACSGMVPLHQNTVGTLILDDAGLLFPGMIPLIIACNPGLTRLVVTYDSSQGRAPFPVADALTRADPLTASWLNQFSSSYCCLNRRLALDVADLFGVPAGIAMGDETSHGCVYVVAKPPRDIPLIVTSPRFAETKTFGGTPTWAMRDVQGISVDGDIAIDCGGLTNSVADAMLWTAITRCNGNVFLVLPSPPSTATGSMVDETFACSMLLSAILAVHSTIGRSRITVQDDPHRIIARALQAHLAANLSVSTAASLGLTRSEAVASRDFIRRDATEFTNAEYFVGLPAGIERTPALGHALSGAGSDLRYSASDSYRAPPVVEGGRFEHIRHELRHFLPVTQEHALSETHRPSEDLPDLRSSSQLDSAVLHHPVVYGLDREKDVPPFGATQQFSRVGSALGAHHTRRDDATVKLSLDARIHPKQALIRQDSRDRARALVKGFKSFATLGDRSFNESLFEQCINDSLLSWAGGRTKRQITNSILNNPVDWDPLFVSLFLKSQRIKKLPKAQMFAGKGQIVTNVSYNSIFSDAAMALYVERSLSSHLRPGVYLHSRSPPSVMSRFYQRYWDKSAKVTYCDYTGWDTNVDEAFSLLYAEIMRSYGVPAEYVESFIHRRHNSRSFLGPMPAMQFSGDRFTWLNNTMGNMALTGCSFKIPRGTAVAFSGDDMIVCGAFVFKSNTVNRKFLPTVVTGESGEFCGFMFGESELHISSRVLLHRGQMALEDGRRDAAYWTSFDYTLRYANSGSIAPDLHFDAALSLSRIAHERFNIPPSRFV